MKFDKVEDKPAPAPVVSLIELHKEVQQLKERVTALEAATEKIVNAGDLELKRLLG